MFISNIYFANWFGGFKSVSDYEWAFRARMQAVYPQKRGIRLLCRCRYFHYCKILCNCNVKNKVITILCNKTFQSFSFLLKRVQGKTSFWKKMLWRKYLTKKLDNQPLLVRQLLKFLLIFKNNDISEFSMDRASWKCPYFLS